MTCYNSIIPYPHTLQDLPDDVVVLRHINSGKLMYACPDRCWSTHLETWRRNPGPDCLEPMPWGHLMFERPLAYACLDARIDPTEQQRREAWRSYVTSMLGHWLNGVPDDKAKAIVNATVKAKLAGVDTGVWPFRAAIMAQI